MHNCGYGMAFVLGAEGGPSTAVDNTVIEPKFNGIDVVGDSPIIRGNQVLRPRALALNVKDFTPPSGATVQSKPFLEKNTFGAPGSGNSIAAGGAPKPESAARPR
jgi:hypothetical protein